MTISSSAGASRQRIAPFLAFSATVHRHEAVRAAIRAAVATSLAYCACKLLHVPDETWAVISALYVLQTSVGGTVNVAIGRVMGAGLGIGLGLACVLLLGSAAWLDLLALLLAVGILGAIGEVRPQLRYGAVVAAIIIISPGDTDVLSAALQKAYAIGLGSGIGALAGAFIFPVTAHQSARNHLASAVNHCGSLIALAFDPESQCGNKDWTKHHEAVGRELMTTRDRLGQSRWLKRSGDDRHGDMLQAVDRLWHHLSMFDRMVSGGERHPSESQQQLLSRSSKASCAYMSELAHIIAGHDPERDKMAENRRELDEVSRSWKRLLEKDSDDRSSAQDQQLEIVGFGWRQVRREMAHLAESAGVGEGRREVASG